MVVPNQDHRGAVRSRRIGGTVHFSTVPVNHRHWAEWRWRGVLPTVNCGGAESAPPCTPPRSCGVRTTGDAPRWWGIATTGHFAGAK